MESIFLGIEAIQTSGRPPEVVEIAAIVIGESGKEVGIFQSVINPGQEILALLSQEAMGLVGLTHGDLRAGESPSDAAEGLRSFLKGHPEGRLIVYNLDRAKKLLGRPPWSIREGWGMCVQEELTSRLQEDLGGTERPKLYEAAQALKIPLPMRRRALSDARLCMEIIRKTQQSRAKISDVDFLKEAEYLMENGL